MYLLLVTTGLSLSLRFGVGALQQSDLMNLVCSHLWHSAIKFACHLDCQHPMVLGVIHATYIIRTSGLRHGPVSCQRGAQDVVRARWAAVSCEHTRNVASVCFGGKTLLIKLVLNADV